MRDALAALVPRLARARRGRARRGAACIDWVGRDADGRAVLVLIGRRRRRLGAGRQRAGAARVGRGAVGRLGPARAAGRPATGGRASRPAARPELRRRGAGGGARAPRIRSLRLAVLRFVANGSDVTPFLEPIGEAPARRAEQLAAPVWLPRTRPEPRRAPSSRTRPTACADRRPSRLGAPAAAPDLAEANSAPVEIFLSPSSRRCHYPLRPRSLDTDAGALAAGWERRKACRTGRIFPPGERRAAGRADPGGRARRLRFGLTAAMSARVFRFVEKRLRNRADVEETVQEVFINIFSSLASFRAEAPFAAWVFGIARHTIAGRFKRKQHPTVPLDVDEDGDIDSEALNGPMSRAADPARGLRARERIARLERDVDARSLGRAAAAVPAPPHRAPPDRRDRAAPREERGRGEVESLPRAAATARALDLERLGVPPDLSWRRHELRGRAAAVRLPRAAGSLGARGTALAENPELRARGSGVLEPRRPRARPRDVATPRSGALPLVLLQNGSGGVERERALAAIGAGWAARGAAVASIDLPLHGRAQRPEVAARASGAARPFAVSGARRARARTRPPGGDRSRTRARRALHARSGSTPSASRSSGSAREPASGAPSARSSRGCAPQRSTRLARSRSRRAAARAVCWTGSRRARCCCSARRICRPSARTCPHTRNAGSGTSWPARSRSERSRSGRSRPRACAFCACGL